MLRVTFKSKGRSGRVWEADFDMGSDEANSLMALEVAHKMWGSIVKSERI